MVYISIIKSVHLVVAIEDTPYSVLLLHTAHTAETMQCLLLNLLL
jgi:hypothetical protein